MEVTDRYGGSCPSTLTACGECEGTGQFSCRACSGTGRRVSMRFARVLEFFDSFAAPVMFAAWWWRGYGFSPNGDGGAVGAFRMVWRQRRHARSIRKLLRGLALAE